MNTDFLDSIVAAFHAVLNLDVRPGDDFFDLGGDSLTSEMVLTRISSDTGIDLPGWVLLDYPRPVDLAAYMDGLTG